MTKSARPPIAVIAENGSVHPIPVGRPNPWADQKVRRFLYTRAEVDAAHQEFSRQRANELEQARSAVDYSTGQDEDEALDTDQPAIRDQVLAAFNAKR